MKVTTVNAPCEAKRMAQLLSLLLKIKSDMDAGKPGRIDKPSHSAHAEDAGAMPANHFHRGKS